MTSFRILLTIIFTLLFLTIIGYIDFNIITPLLPLPDDICYYHTNEPPIWIRLFYLDSMEHTEPPFSGLHMLALLVISFLLGRYTAIRFDKWLLKQEKNNNNKIT